MDNYTPILGAHTKMNKKNNYLVGSLKEAILYKANTFMIFTGPPQSSIRTPINNMNLELFNILCFKNNIDKNNLVIHAPYIINLCNLKNKNTFEFSKNFLRKEINRAIAIGIKYIVLHPGSSLGIDRKKALIQLSNALNNILKPEDNIIICLETMSGKGSEVCSSFEEISFVISNIKLKEKVAVCFDTCHVNDAGYDLKNNLEKTLILFDKIIGLNRIKVIHLNDSKNNINSHKDRHENIGYGTIGFNPLLNIVFHPKLKSVIKILETPYVNGNSPYKQEIAMLKNKKMNNWK